MNKLEAKAKSLSDVMLERVIVTLSALQDDDARFACDYMEVEYIERHGVDAYENLLDRIAA